MKGKLKNEQDKSGCQISGIVIITTNLGHYMGKRQSDKTNFNYCKTRFYANGRKQLIPDHSRAINRHAEKPTISII